MMKPNKQIRINRIRIDILDEMNKNRKKPFKISNLKRYDILQNRLEKCNLFLFGYRSKPYSDFKNLEQNEL